jgi:acetyl-CoA acetyltransferase
MPGSVIVSGSRTPLETSPVRSRACRPPTSTAWPSRTHSARPASRATRWTTSSWARSSRRGKSQPSNAIAKALKREGFTSDDIDVFETNEAFASVAIQSMRDLGLAPDNVNVDVGAISTGHPVGMSGARLVLHLALELKRRGGGVGAAGLCGGGGQGDALLIRVPASSA